MADAKLFIGGMPSPNFPNCNGAYEFTEPHARRIAFEYANGYFTLGWPLQPSVKNYQLQELMSADVGANDHIMMGFYAGTAEISVIPVLNRLPMYPGQ